MRRRVGSGGSDADPVFNLRPVCRRRVSEREAFSHVAQHQKWRPMHQMVADHATLGASFPQEHLRFPAVLHGNISKTEEEERKGVESHWRKNSLRLFPTRISVTVNFTRTSTVLRLAQIRKTSRLTPLLHIVQNSRYVSFLAVKSVLLHSLSCKRAVKTGQKG